MLHDDSIKSYPVMFLRMTACIYKVMFIRCLLDLYSIAYALTRVKVLTNPLFRAQEKAAAPGSRLPSYDISDPPMRFF